MARGRKKLGEEDKHVKMNRETLREAVKIFRFVKPYRWSLYIGLLFLFFSSLTFLLIFTLFRFMIDSAEGKLEYDISLSQIGIFLVAILLIQGFVSYTRVMLFAKASENGIADLRKSLYDKIITLPIVFFEKNRSGELVSRVTSDTEKLYGAFSVTLAEFIRQIIMLIGCIIFLGYTSLKLTLIMVSTFPVVVIAAMFFGRYIRKLSKEKQAALAESNIILNETVQTVSAVKSFTNEVYESLRYGGKNDQVVKVAMKFAQGRALFSAFIVTVLFGALCFVVWQAVLMLETGELTAGKLVAFVSYTGIIGAAIASLGSFYTDLLGAIGATERVREILSMDPEVDLAEAKSDVSKLSGKIEYKNVSFAYPTRDDLIVLKDLNLKVEEGQKVALVGQSGSGKSTIVQLLLRFYDLTGGEILVDGKNINDYGISGYRSHIAIVPQEVMLFGGTIRENILYGKPDANEEEVIKAAKEANAWEFIQQFPEGLETIVGERGIKLSGGQRQRIAIARAILKDPAILLLDEATSSLDAESERVVQDALNKLMEGRTSIIIAHRLATIRDVDCIFVMEDGKIIETGTHDELSVSGGAYSQLAKLQFDLVE